MIYIRWVSVGAVLQITMTDPLAGRLDPRLRLIAETDLDEENVWIIDGTLDPMAPVGDSLDMAERLRTMDASKGALPVDLMQEEDLWKSVGNAMIKNEEVVEEFAVCVLDSSVLELASSVTETVLTLTLILAIDGRLCWGL